MTTRRYQEPHCRRPVATTHFHTTATPLLRSSQLQLNKSGQDYCTCKLAAGMIPPLAPRDIKRTNCENLSRNLEPFRCSRAARILMASLISISLAVTSLGLINCDVPLGQPELAATVRKIEPNFELKASAIGKDHLLTKRQATISFDDHETIPSGRHGPNDDEGATSDEPDATSEHHRANGAASHDDPLPPPQPLASSAIDQFIGPNFVQPQTGLRDNSGNSVGGSGSGSGSGSSSNSKLHIVRLFGPESIQNGTQNVTLDCMFKFDPKLDQRLTIKWFFNDELEPIYQWIPELNKRVYSDKYEHMIDKSYQVTDDVDWMLQEYKLLLSEQQAATTAPPQSSSSNALDDNNSNSNDNGAYYGGSGRAMQQQRQQLINKRKLDANRLAKMVSDHSKQLLKTLRSLLYMDSDEASKYRALRLIGPTLNMSGRYTCSISSLDGDDLQSTRLTIYEPPKSFAFTVTRTPSGQMYNLTCQAGSTYPRPSLALYRYRASPSDQTAPAGQQQQQPSAPTGDLSGRHAHRPRLASTQLKQEPLPGTQTQLTIGASRQSQSAPRLSGKGGGKSDNGAPMFTSDLDSAATSDDNDIVAAVATHSSKQANDELTASSSSSQLSAHNYNDDDDNDQGYHRVHQGNDDNELASSATSQYRMSVGAYEITAWALVDEASLSTNLVTQFECVLTIEGTDYEQRQSLALQKGWHVNSQALMARSTLVGLMSVLASILCLCIALVSALLVFRIMRRHANKSSRVHQQMNNAAATKAETGLPTSRLGRSHSREGKFAAAGGGHKQLGQTNRSCELDSSASQASSSPSSSTASTAASSSTGGAIDDHGRQLGPLGQSESTNGQRQQHQLGQRTPAPSITARQVHYSSFSGLGGHYRQVGSTQPQSNYANQQQHQAAAAAMEASGGFVGTATHSDWQSDGIYRVPDTQNQRGQIQRQQQQQQQQQQLLAGTRFVIGSEGQSPAAWTDQVYQNNKLLAGRSGNFHDPNLGLATGGGGVGAATGSQATTGRGQLSGMLRAIPSAASAASAPSPLASTTRGATSEGQQAGGVGGGGIGRHTPATISVNGKQLYC